MHSDVCTVGVRAPVVPNLNIISVPVVIKDDNSPQTGSLRRASLSLGASLGLNIHLHASSWCYSDSRASALLKAQSGIEKKSPALQANVSRNLTPLLTVGSGRNSGRCDKERL
jgi:hypothetical protein